MEIAIATGEHGRALLADADFLAAWGELAALDPKFTLLQEPPFVRAWFRAYAEVYAPVIVTARGHGGALAALMPLALRKRDGKLTHAGAEQAEYHGWIARPAEDAAFPLHALAALRREIPFGSWQWRWGPPGTPLDWTGDPALARAGLHVAVERRNSPVLDLRDGDKLKKLLSNKSLRAKMNRYRKAGGYRFERIRDPGQACDLMAEIARQCDFRQEAINGVRPFADDPCKAAFFVERMQDPDAVHFTVLWNGERPLAFHIGGCDGRTCLLGLSTFGPADSRNSPGSLLLVELARMLCEEGFEQLDLTPGTDPYKQRFATSEQELARLTVLGTRAAALRSRATTAVKGAIVDLTASRGLAAQERFARWQRDLKAARHRLRELGLAGVFARGGATGGGRVACLVTRIAGDPPEAAGDGIGRQAWADLMTASAGLPASIRRARLSAALGRFQEGQTLYSLREGDAVRITAWLHAASGDERGQALADRGVVAADAPLIHAIDWCGTVPAGAALRHLLAGILGDLAAGGQSEAVLLIDAGEAEGMGAARALGFADAPAAPHATEEARADQSAAPN
ncbi:GNAT family N-acetyltransferase [Limibaculum sp. M0105]|uniref:GNAT family N-acetyltransferase n=1 Tax=Thermohalobaculum xanthum TaxID=2753746 RepID=A0A8J7SFX0_9RHOB|nr:GNAT family N-acetyltransferase [Thermohalobaculum xanthum]MBK0400426.1 GNAT family N-acetyltransferase [Thermohalobaculum xanthum]